MDEYSSRDLGFKELFNILIIFHNICKLNTNPAKRHSMKTSLPVRALCVKCLKAQVTCLCRSVKKFKTRFQIVLLQHPMERRKAIGTARMTHLSIENSKLICGKDFNDHSQVKALIANPDHHCVVLFPGLNSFNLSHAPQNERLNLFPSQKKLVVFVIDGTWASAKRMLRDSENLLALPQICFTPQKLSEYKIRQQPMKHCVSTIEAVHQLLGLLEPSVPADDLLVLFREMVELQVQHFNRNQVLESSPIELP